MCVMCVFIDCELSGEVEKKLNGPVRCSRLGISCVLHRCFFLRSARMEARKFKSVCNNKVYLLCLSHVSPAI